MKKWKLIFWQMLLLFSVQLLFCQQLSAQIKGKVTDSNGIGLPGVSIKEKDSKNGSITDFDGNYQIKTVKPDAVLVFSFIGMASREITVEGKRLINVVLEDDTKNLDEVVVVAYGTQKKVSVTGSISSVNQKELKQSPSSNFVGAMTGRLPGLTTIQSSGQPGAENFQMYIRGASTTNGTQPLVLVDGVPRDIITSIDPNEIEGVSILKDASATAVFGVRGANGVILITTKRGNKGIPQLSVTAEYGLQDFTRFPNTMDSWQFATLRRQALNNDILPIPAGFSDAAIEKYRSGVEPFKYPNSNWFKTLLKPNAPMSRFNVNVSGGNDRVKYFMNTSYTHQGTIYNTESKNKLGYDPAYKMDRYNFRTNLDVKMNNWIKSSMNLAGYIESVNSANGIGIYSPITMMYAVTPLIPGPVTIAGYGVPVDEVLGTASNANPYFAVMNRTGYKNTTRASLNSSLAFDFDLNWITKGLTSKVLVSFDTKSTSNISGDKGYDKYNFLLTQLPDPTDPTKMVDNVSITPNAAPEYHPLVLTKTASFLYNLNLQWALNYKRTFGKNTVTGLALVQRDNNEAANGSSDILLPYNVFGVAGRATYDFDNRYLFEVNLGYNGSEQFSKENRFGFFPAASVGWVASNEEFMKTQKVITNLKFRASYGTVGNDKLGSDRFLYLDNTSVISSSSYGISPSLGLGKYINEDLIGNPQIKWETSYKQNYGMEMALFNDLTFTGDVYFEKRESILLQRGTVPELQGLPLSVIPKANIGKVNNKGFELELAYTKFINRDFSFVIRGNYNYNENVVINLDEPQFDSSYAYKYNRTGYSLSQNWGYLIDWNSPGKGYFTSKDEITNSGLTYGGIQPHPGDFVYKDLNGDNVINDRDKAPIKYGNIPRITYGASLSVTYKGFDFSALLQATAQASDYYTSWGITENTGEGYFSDIHINAWTKERYEAKLPISYPALTTIATGSSSLQANDFFIMDKSFIRLKNAEIGYIFPTKFVKKIGAQKIRFYLNGQNIFLWDHLLVNTFDPEQTYSWSNPITRVFNIGANIAF